MDMNPDSWSATLGANGPDIQDVAESLLTFIRAFHLLHSENSVSFIAAHTNSSKMLYSPEIRARRWRSEGKSLTVLEMDSIDTELHKLIVEFSTENQQSNTRGMPSMLSSAFAIAACYCNRITSTPLAGSSTASKPIPRVLTITPCTDFSGQYVALMNCFFSFEKSGILLDSFVLSESVRPLSYSVSLSDRARLCRPCHI